MRTLIAIPCHEKIDVGFANSLMYMQRATDDGLEWSVSSLIYDARNDLLKKAIEYGAEYILWLDSDMIFEPDLLERMFDSIGDGDFLSALYFRRKPPYKPCIYKSLDFEGNDDGIIPIADEYIDYPRNSKFEIAACGFGAVLMRTEMGANIWRTRGLPFSPVMGFGEDLSFCYKAKCEGYKLLCDSSIKLGHISQMVVNENYYEAYKETVKTE